MEEDSRISYVALREDPQFTKLRKDNGLGETYGVNTLVQKFQNEAGPFVDFPEKGTQDRVLTLNSNFWKATERFVENFLREFYPEQPLNRAVAPDLFEVIFIFMRTKYLQAWTDLIGKIVKAAPRSSISKKTLGSELDNRAPNWVMILTVWRKHLGDPHPDLRTDRPGLFSATYDYMRAADDKEVDRCIKLLSATDGPQILIKRQAALTDVYLINSEIYQEALTTYTDKLINLNCELAELIQSKGYW